MGTSNLKTTSVTNLDATPAIRANPWINGQNSKSYVGRILAVTADDTSSTYRFFRVGSWMRCHALALFCDALSTSAAVNVGLWNPSNISAGAVVDADFFASAVVVSSALNGTDITYESANAASNMGLPVAESRLWEVMALTADPNLQYDVTIQPTSAITAGGNIVLRASFVY